MSTTRNRFLLVELAGMIVLLAGAITVFILHPERVMPVSARLAVGASAVRCVPQARFLVREILGHDT
jgi:hypothetical protein